MFMKLVDRFIRSLTTLPCLSALEVNNFYGLLFGELVLVGVGTEESFVSRVESKRAFETRTPGSASTWSPYSSESSLFH